MTFLTIFVVFLGAILGFLAARRAAPTWSAFNQILVGSSVILLVASALVLFVHTILLVLVLVGGAAFLLSFSISEHCRDRNWM